MSNALFFSVRPDARLEEEMVRIAKEMDGLVELKEFNKLTSKTDIIIRFKSKRSADAYIEPMAKAIAPYYSGSELQVSRI
jgi:hypothetical protein